MTEGKKGFEFDENVAQQLNLLFRTAELRKLRRQYFDLFALSGGEAVLDLGCGTGANAMALVDHLQGNCNVIGVDTSKPMLAIGERNLQSFAYPDRIRLQFGDAHELPFPEGGFDAAMIIQVLEYSNEPIRMLQETRRILKPGGKVFVADTDWDTVVWNSNLKDRTRQIVLNWSDHEADGWQGRKILEYLTRAGFQSVQGRTLPIAESSFSEDSYSYLFTKIIIDYLIRSEKMAASELEEWMQDLKSKAEAGHFYFSLNRYAFVGYKASDGTPSSRQRAVGFKE
jgi:arsenite methyltransferase